jgi:peptidoglycan hydrolase-like protein with peptidoglycan-binding domain
LGFGDWIGLQSPIQPCFFALSSCLILTLCFIINSNYIAAASTRFHPTIPAVTTYLPSLAQKTFFQEFFTQMQKKHVLGMLAFACLMPSLAISYQMDFSLDKLSQSVQRLPATLTAFLDQRAIGQEELPAPGLYAISRGSMLESGHVGRSVLLVKRLLSELDYEVRPGDFFDQHLASQIGAFQQQQGLAEPSDSHWGKVGPATLQALRTRVVWSMYSPGRGQALANYARSHISGGSSFCYTYVARAIHAKNGAFLNGMHAYMASDYLAQNKGFREVAVPLDELAKLPAGAIVVWDKGTSRSGHISIADGKGNEISDHVSPQMLSHYGGAGYRVFLTVNPPSLPVRTASRTASRSATLKRSL